MFPMLIIGFTKTYGDVGQVEMLDPVWPNAKAGASLPVEFLKVKGFHWFR